MRTIAMVSVISFFGFSCNVSNKIQGYYHVKKKKNVIYFSNTELKVGDSIFYYVHDNFCYSSTEKGTGDIKIKEDTLYLNFKTLPWHIENNIVEDIPNQEKDSIIYKVIIEDNQFEKSNEYLLSHYIFRLHYFDEGKIRYEEFLMDKMDHEYHFSFPKDIKYRPFGMSVQVFVNNIGEVKFWGQSIFPISKKHLKSKRIRILSIPIKNHHTFQSGDVKIFKIKNTLRGIQLIDIQTKTKLNQPTKKRQTSMAGYINSFGN